MEKLIALVLLIFSMSVFATDSETIEYKQNFIDSFSIEEKGNEIYLKEKFGDFKSYKIKNDLVVSSKRDKHINTMFKITNIENDYLYVEFTQTQDLRSFGGKLTKNKGIFSVAYK